MVKEEWEKDKRKKQRQTQKLNRREGKRKKDTIQDWPLFHYYTKKNRDKDKDTTESVFFSILPLHEAAVGKSEGVPSSAHLHVLNQSEVADLHQ